MLTLLAVVASAACSGLMPNPEPVKQPAAWSANREAATRANAPTAPARAGDPAPGPALPQPQDPSKQAPQPAPATTSGQAGQIVLARVAGEPIDVLEYLKLSLHGDPQDVFDKLNRLIANRLVGLEGARLGITVDEAGVEQAYKDTVDKMEKSLQKKYPGITIDKFVDSRLGLDPLLYRSVLRDDARRGWLAGRCVRSFVLQSEHANVRLIAVKTEEELKSAQAELAAGTPFEEVAKKRSADGSAKDGGLISPVVKGDSPMGRLAFNTAVGAIGGPQFEGGAWLLVKVESRPKPLEGGWKEISAEVEKSLATRDLDDIEYKQWEAAMQKRYQIDLTPVLRLCGEPVR